MEFLAAIRGQGVPRSCPPLGLGVRGAFWLVGVVALGLGAGHAEAQSPGPDAPAVETPPEPTLPDLMRRIAALEAEVSAQREELAAQREQASAKPQD